MANSNDAFELSDEQLEMVSGGSSAPLVSNVVQVNNEIGVAVAPTANTFVNIGGSAAAQQVGAKLSLGFLGGLSTKF